MNEKGSLYLARFNQVMHECDSAYHRAAARLGLSDTAFWLFYYIRLSDHAPTQKEISDFFFLPKQTVHSALRGFLEQGILELRAEAGKREKSICVTPQGDRYLCATIDQVLAAEKTVFSRADTAELERYLSLCRTITDALTAKLEQITAPETPASPELPGQEAHTK